MKAFLDTSVLVAAFYADHEHHGQSLELFVHFPKGEVGCSAHTLLEIYATLTGMPGKHRVSPDEALLFISDIRERLTIVALKEQEYAELLESSAAKQVMGGAIYDSLLMQCALKARAEALFTWNIKDFQRFAHSPLRVCLPSDTNQV